MACLFFTESSHDIVESSRYIPRDRSHMRTTEIFEFGRHYGSKKTDSAKKRTADAREKRFWAYCF